MGKYSIKKDQTAQMGREQETVIQLNNIANELAEANRIGRLHLQFLQAPQEMKECNLHKEFEDQA